MQDDADLLCALLDDAAVAIPLICLAGRWDRLVAQMDTCRGAKYFNQLLSTFSFFAENYRQGVSITLKIIHPVMHEALHFTSAICMRTLCECT